MIIAESTTGSLEFEGNEQKINSKIEDPGKLRFRAESGVGSGAISWNRRIDDTDRENVLLQGKQDETVRDDPRNPRGELTLHLNDGTSYEDAAMVRVLEFRPDTVELLGVKFTREDLVALQSMIRNNPELWNKS